ncbi:MAG TPA: hypothetical protein VJB87_02025 [Candidatus Nanoarchaeia archaeon]|nr:hypothetical protein [Candidatus Nanoarchaeia archaeon]
MISKQRKEEARKNFNHYLEEGLIKKEQSNIAKEKYLENAELSLQTADELLQSTNKPWLWIIVIAYYTMFYSANAALLHLGYKVGHKIAHQITNEALITLITNKLTEELLEDYETIQQDALTIAATQAEEIIESYEYEKTKRSTFQYNMLEQSKENKARTSYQRAKEFLFAMKKVIKQ